MKNTFSLRKSAHAHRSAFGKAVSAAVMVTGLFAANATAGAGTEPPRFEALHFWASPTEQRAFRVFSDEFRQRHEVRWEERSVTSFNALRKEALQRIVSGYPPDVVQWHPSPEIWELYDMQVIYPITAVARKLRLDDRLPEVVRQTVVTDGEYVGLPTNIHGENFMWFSTKLYEELELEHPESWEQVLDQARVISDAGYTAVTMGNQDWEKRLMFSAILNSLSSEAYLALVSTGEPDLARHPAVLRAFRIMAELRDASQVETVPKEWVAAAELMASGQAAMQFMGDWLDRELTTQGWKIGEDFHCSLPPGENPSFMIVVDGFIFPVTGANGESLHKAFAEVVLEPEIQVEFALKKGALPVIKGLSDPRFDRCSKIGLEALQDESRLTPSSAMFTALNFGNVIQSVAVELWHSQMSASQAVEMLHEELVIVSELEQAP